MMEHVVRLIDPWYTEKRKDPIISLYQMEHIVLFYKIIIRKHFNL